MPSPRHAAVSYPPHAAHPPPARAGPAGARADQQCRCLQKGLQKGNELCSQVVLHLNVHLKACVLGVRLMGGGSDVQSQGVPVNKETDGGFRLDPRGEARL